MYRVTAKWRHMHVGLRMRLNIKYTFMLSWLHLRFQDIFIFNLIYFLFIKLAGTIFIR